jgi:hypothetical protein
MVLTTHIGSGCGRHGCGGCGQGRPRSAMAVSGGGWVAVWHGSGWVAVGKCVAWQWMGGSGGKHTAAESSVAWQWMGGSGEKCGMAVDGVAVNVWHGSGRVAVDGWHGSGCETAIKRVSRRHYLYQNPPKQPFLYLIHHFISKPPFLYQNSSFSYQKPPFLYQNSSFLYQIRPQKPEKRIKKPQKPPTAPFPPRLRTRIASVSCDVAPPPRFDFEIFVEKIEIL